MATTSAQNTDNRPKLTIERFHYRCDSCNNKFNWDANCRHSGTYKDLDEGVPVATFCCAGCKATWKAKQPHSSRTSRATKS